MGKLISKCRELLYSAGSRTWGSGPRDRPTESAMMRGRKKRRARERARSCPPGRTRAGCPRRSSEPTIGQAMSAMKRPKITGRTSEATSRRASTPMRTSTNPPIAESGPGESDTLIRARCHPHRDPHRRRGALQALRVSFSHPSPSRCQVGSADQSAAGLGPRRVDLMNRHAVTRLDPLGARPIRSRRALQARSTTWHGKRISSTTEKQRVAPLPAAVEIYATRNRGEWIEVR